LQTVKQEGKTPADGQLGEKKTEMKEISSKIGLGGLGCVLASAQPFFIK
jgi:hypothetical protein